MSIEDLTTNFDPINQPIEGYARAAVEQGRDGHFKCPLVTQITETLWTGGCIGGVRLPDDFKYVISMYPWEKFEIGPKTVRYEHKMYDSLDQTLDAVELIAKDAKRCVTFGKTLIHCQAGLNRSGLIAGRTLMLLGHTADEAIALLREKRSPEVLCNRHFEDYLRSL